MGRLTSANTSTSNPTSFTNIENTLAREEIKYLKNYTKVPEEKTVNKNKLIKMGEENGYSWFCWRRSPGYSAAAKTEVEPAELNPSPPDTRVNGELFASPLQRASGTVLVELVELPIGPFSISTSDTNNNDNNNNKCEELSNGPTSHHTSYSPSTSAGPRLPSTSISSSISSISSSSLPPYSELVKELGTL